jgi:sulfide:quinone oxidoreductase
VRDSFELVWTIYESNYIQAFGPKLHDVVVPEFAARGIRGHNEWALNRVNPGTTHYANGESIGFDLLVAFPPYIAAVRYEGLPHDERGFLKTELESRRVSGQERIYAPGNAGDFPVKHSWRCCRPTRPRKRSPRRSARRRRRGRSIRSRCA